MNNLSKKTVFLFTFTLSALIYGCSKSKLTGEYEILKGRYQWEHTGTDDHNFWTNDDPSVTDSMTAWTAAFELDGDGAILFYQDGQLIKDSKYTVLERESYDEHSAYIYIKLKDTDGFNLDDGKLTIRLSLDTVMDVTGFPFPAIDDVENYYSGNTELNNHFRPDN